MKHILPANPFGMAPTAPKVAGKQEEHPLPLLYKIERRGWAKGEWEKTPAGVKRRCYSLTAAGLKQLAASRREWGLFFRALDRFGGLSRA